eukprot:1443567-Rhodomonas_salina.2
MGALLSKCCAQRTQDTYRTRVCCCVCASADAAHTRGAHTHKHTHTAQTVRADLEEDDVAVGGGEAVVVVLDALAGPAPCRREVHHHQSRP